jgi:tetratricopeptide (TPR) repeat protein
MEEVMIICNNCGNPVENGMQFCTECGGNIPVNTSTFASPPKTTSTGATGAVMSPRVGYTQPAPATQPLVDIPAAADSGSIAADLHPAQGYTKILIGLISVVAVLAIAVAIYFALESSPASKAAAALQSAVNNNQLVTMSSNDAYTYYMQLKGLDPSNKALTEVGQKVLPQLRSMGDEVFSRKMQTNVEKLSDQDWARTLRVYEWAHDIAPTDKQIEARWRFASGEVAKSQKRLDEAERAFSAASQNDSSWALPQNSLGLLRSESRKWAEALPYYQRAIELKSNWEIPYNNMGTAYYYLKDLDSAQSWYQKAVQINPNWARPHYWLGQTYQQRNWKTQAIEEYQKALELDSNNYSITSDEQVNIQKRIAQLQK